MLRYCIALVILAAACGSGGGKSLSGSDTATVTLSGGDVMTERAYQSNISALIDDMGYAHICRTLAPTTDDDLGKSTAKDRERVIVLHREVCDSAAEASR